MQTMLAWMMIAATLLASVRLLRAPAEDRYCPLQAPRRVPPARRR